MKKKQGPAAFLSYVHEDDKHGHITKLCERLTDEVQTAVGEEFNIFQDRKDIQWGQNWRERIEGSIDEVTFLIPVITPRFFNSKHCRDELRRFLEREKALGRSDLILPIYFVDTPLLNSDELRAKDDLAQAIASRQYGDWRELRWEPLTNPQVGRTLERLARQIRDALPTVQATAPPRAPAETQPTASPAKERSEQATQPPSPKNEPTTCTVNPMPRRGNFTTISAAIKKSAPGTKIIVQPGFYQEGLIINKPLEIVGEGEPGEVVVQASGKEVILFQTNMGRVTNLTLRQTGGGNFFAVKIAQGRLELEDCDITSQSLACVAIHNGADPRLRRNRIHDGKEAGVQISGNGLGTLEDNDIFGNTLSGVEIRSGGNPTLRRNRIRDGKQSGVAVYEDALGTLEDNDISGNGFAGITIFEGGDPMIRRNRIHDGKQGGVFVYEGGLGTLEDNDIYGNLHSGVRVQEDARPTLRNNRINKNGSEAILVHEGGGGTFEGNDLRDNAEGAWTIDPDCEANVKRADNQE
ncbi:MAG TPA: right-handed parallel beta-helix repeat-containing protein [Pyrinomonadaceae bacterium]|jgi:F-box protein 11|nr:right-handed parallel beta-helix repeat-containing protein [Pyrinomonadaceae bacterium]